MKYLSGILIILLFSTCGSSGNQESVLPPEPVQVELVTSMGNVVLELSDKTPLHRDNFIKIVDEGWLDSMLFHRVLKGFVVQAGAYDSLKSANMDSMERVKMEYRVPAEFDTSLFHKRGALGAARTGNPERASSSLSFYIVHRGPVADSTITKDEKRINGWLQEHYFLQAPENKVWLDSLMMAEDNRNWQLSSSLWDTINALSKSFEDYQEYQIPEQQREVYRTTGGTPHLDQNYTVFGEVVRGMEVIDSIAEVNVNRAGWPDENVYILSARILEKTDN